MKRFAWFAALLMTALIVVSAAVTVAPPARADSIHYSLGASAYKEASKEYASRLTSLPSMDNSATTLNLWTKDVVAKTNAYAAAIITLQSQIDIEVVAEYPGSSAATKCNRLQATLLGPYGSGVGFNFISNNISGNLTYFADALNQLNADENKLLSKIGDERLNGQRIDPTLVTLLAAVQNAIKTLGPARDKLAKAGSDSQKTLGMARDDYDDLCTKTTATPAPPPRPSRSPSPKPTLTPKPPTTVSAHGCIGFNGYWANQTFSNPMHVAGNSATHQRATSAWTFTGTVAGKVMSGTYTSSRGDKGTFTFTLAYSDPDYIDVVTYNSYGNNQGLLTFNCVRGP